MNLMLEERLSDTPFVAKIWWAQSDRAGAFTSVATNHWEMVVTRYQGQTTFTVRGPETKATPAFCPPETEFLGIVFKPGVYMPPLSPKSLRDRKNVTLPEAAGQTFWLHGSAWQFPNYENVDTFADVAYQAGYADQPHLTRSLKRFVGQTPGQILSTE